MPSIAGRAPTALTGIILAAGAGTRMGSPKALLKTGDGTPWLEIAVRLMQRAGCNQIVAVLGARAEEARALVPAATEIVLAADWAEGMGASLAAGLQASTGDCALISLVDLPDLPATVVLRVAAEASRGALAQATFGGRPGHPVLIGRDHIAGVLAVLSAKREDRGARTYLVANDVTEIDCTDLFDGHDVDSFPPS